MKRAIQSGSILILTVLLLSGITLGDSSQTTEPTPGDEAAVLVKQGNTVAEKALLDGGRLVPFAMVMTLEGEIRKETAGNSEVSLVKQLRGGAADGRYIAVAIFTADKMTDPRINEKVKVVKIGIEHVDGFCSTFHIPYTLPLKELNRNELMMTDRQGQFFAACRR